MEKRRIWMRLGVTLEGTKEEIETLLSDDYDLSKNALKKILTEGRYKVDGDSYIPETCVEEYNNDYGTDHEVDDVSFCL